MPRIDREGSTDHAREFSVEVLGEPDRSFFPTDGIDDLHAREAVSQLARSIERLAARRLSLPAHHLHIIRKRDNR